MCLQRQLFNKRQFDKFSITVIVFPARFNKYMSCTSTCICWWFKNDAIIPPPEEDGIDLARCQQSYKFWFRYLWGAAYVPSPTNCVHGWMMTFPSPQTPPPGVHLSRENLESEEEICDSLTIARLIDTAHAHFMFSYSTRPNAVFPPERDNYNTNTSATESLNILLVGLSDSIREDNQTYTI